MPAKKQTTDVVSADSAFAETLSFEDYLDQGVIAGNEALDEGTFIGQDQKEDLVGVPFVVLDWTHDEMSGGIPKVTVTLVLANSEKCTMVDTSAGIRLQLEDMTRKMNGWPKDGDIPNGLVTIPPRPLYFPNGLRVSHYGYEDKLEGRTIQAATYYLDSKK